MSGGGPDDLRRAEAEYNRLSDVERERILRKIGTERNLAEIIPYTKYSMLRFAEFREQFQIWIAAHLADPSERAKIKTLNRQATL